MSNELLNLEPIELWKHFYSLTRIPRPSKHEDRIIEFAKNFGKSLGLETIVDEVGNVIIRKPATAGMENRKGVILQGHLDMVPQKNSDTNHDFENDPIEAWIDGEWVKARGTTLGSDNGMGVAAAMAVLSSNDLVHGPVEALFTIDEETGMTGAFGLKPGILNGDILLNMDSEDEGELYIGCAGGTNANVIFRYNAESVAGDVKAYQIKITGLRGGHSGLDINLGRGNSNKVLFRLIHSAAADFGLRLASVNGGSLRNAIPRESFAEVVVPTDHSAAFEQWLVEFTAVVTAELSRTEPGLKIEAVPGYIPASLIDADTQRRLTQAIYACPNGVIRLSDAMPGLVETSTNLAIVKSIDGEIKIQCLLRSSVDSAKEDLANMVESVFRLAGAEVVMDGTYPGWKPNPDSPILRTMQEVYNAKWGKIPEIKAIHAGLECGILGANYPHWDMISFGPTIRFPHSPDEKVNIPSVNLFWEFLVETLKNVPAR
jgi:dipeptidase D